MKGGVRWGNVWIGLRFRHGEGLIIVIDQLLE